MSASSGVGRDFVADVRTSLRAEFGARAIYGFLAARVVDRELAGVLARFREDGEELIAGLGEVLRGVGESRVPRSSARRVAQAWILAHTSRRARGSIALRMCLESEQRLARTYASYVEYLSRHGHGDLARRCDRLSGTKQGHARVLATWVPS